MNAREEHIAVRKNARLMMLGDALTASDIWIACHGYAQLAARFIRPFESIAGPGRLIVAPEALHRFYIDPPPIPAPERRVGATWMTREDREGDIRDYVAYLDAVVEHVRTDRTRTVRALGFSQGSATVFRWLVLGKSNVDELILWSGEVPADVDMRAAARRLARTRIVLVQGATDHVATTSATLRQLENLRATGIDVEMLEHAGGHQLDPNLLSTLATRN